MYLYKTPNKHKQTNKQTKHQIIQFGYPIKGPQKEHSNKTVKKDTLFKDREPQKPYPIPQHVPI